MTLGVSILMLVALLAEAGRPPLQRRGAEAWNNFQTFGSQPEFSWLALHAVDDETNKAYSKAVRSFLQYAKDGRLPFSTATDIDLALAKFYEKLCYNGESAMHFGQNSFHGFLHFFPWFRGLGFPVAKRSLKAWERMDQGEEGQPLAETTVWALCYLMAKQGYVEEAMVTLLSYDAMARESDWESLSSEDVAVHNDDMALTFGARSRGLRVKTGSDQGVSVDNAICRAWLRRKKHQRARHKTLITFRQNHFRNVWNSLKKDNKLEGIGKVHSLRHSRPSEEAKRGTMTLEQIRRRGRWSQMKSVQRYSKDFALTQHLAVVNDWVTRLGTQVKANPVKLLLHAIKTGRGSHTTEAALAVDALASCKAQKRNCSF